MNPNDLPQDTSAEALARSLEALPLPEAQARLDAAVQSGDAQLPGAVAAHSQGALAKAAKKALYRLKSAGVAAPRSTAAPAPGPGPLLQREESFPSLVSPLLGDGERALVVARSAPQGVLTWEVVLSDETGLSSVDAGELSRSEYRRHVKTLRQAEPPGRAADQSRRVVEIPYAQALALLSRAAAQNQRSGAPLPPGAEAMFRKLEVGPADAPPLPGLLPEDAALSQEGHRLHQEPEIWQWLPPEEQLRQLAVAVDELAKSPIQMTEIQRAEQLTQRVHAAVDRFFTPALRELYARRLWEMADFFERSARPEAAARARAVARRLFHVGSADPFPRFLFEKVLRLSAAQHSAGAHPGREPQPPASPTPLPASPLILRGA